MYRANGVLQPGALHYHGDGEFAGPLGDGDHVDVRSRDRREDAAGEARLARHVLANRGEQSDIAIHVDGVHVMVRQLQRQCRFQSFQSLGELLFADQETETLPIAGTGEQQHFHVGARHGVERPRHYLHAAHFGTRGLKR